MGTSRPSPRGWAAMKPSSRRNSCRSLTRRGLSTMTYKPQWRFGVAATKSPSLTVVRKRTPSRGGRAAQRGLDDVGVARARRKSANCSQRSHSSSQHAGPGDAGPGPTLHSLDRQDPRRWCGPAPQRTVRARGRVGRRVGSFLDARPQRRRPSERPQPAGHRWSREVLLSFQLFKASTRP
jgi:hypothetical protein